MRRVQPQRRSPRVARLRPSLTPAAAEARGAHSERPRSLQQCPRRGVGTVRLGESGVCGADRLLVQGWFCGLCGRARPTRELPASSRSSPRVDHVPWKVRAQAQGAPGSQGEQELGFPCLAPLAAAGLTGPPVFRCEEQTASVSVIPEERLPGRSEPPAQGVHPPGGRGFLLDKWHEAVAVPAETRFWGAFSKIRQHCTSQTGDGREACVVTGTTVLERPAPSGPGFVFNVLGKLG